MEKEGLLTYSSIQENNGRKDLLQLLKECPIKDTQLLSNLGLFLDSRTLSRILFFDFIYKQIIDVQGMIFDYGTRWGHNLILFNELRAIYEPYNRHRVIVGFDTFEGFPSISEKDYDSELMKVGNVSTTKDYDTYLKKLIKVHEDLNPLNHIENKTLIIKGNAIETTEQFLKQNPQTILSLVYFDFDLYEPTKKCLELIKDRLVKGSILAFDELNDPDSPGETLAVMEVLGLNNIRLKKYQYTTRISYFVVE